jgi:predicted esterase
VLLVLVDLAVGGSPVIAQQPRSDDARVRASVEAFWAAPDRKAREAAAAAIVRSGAEFEPVLQALAAGGRYSGAAETGVVVRSRRNSDGTEHLYALIVPESYDPGYRYPVRFFLHGGVSRPAWTKSDRWWDRSRRLAGDSVILVLPVSWSESKWWQRSQVENLSGILEALKATYNVDENRISLWGVSDGGTGVYFHAFTAPTPWASFLPSISSPGVLANPTIGVDGTMFVANLADQSLYIVNGELDPLYPSEGERPYVEMFRAAGANVVFRNKRGYGHNVDWWPEEAAAMERFANEHVRDPLPDRLVWVTDRTDGANRVHWLIIDELARRGQPGRVEVVKRGQTVQVSTSDVRRCRLLISPAEFDLSQPVRVVTNGVTSFDGVLDTNLETLLKWAASDLDRSMLFATEIEIRFED